MRPPEPVKAKGIFLISPVSCVQAGELWSLFQRSPWTFSRGRATVPSPCKISQDVFLTTVCVQTTVFSLEGIPKTVPSSYTTDEEIKVQTTTGCAHVIQLHQSWTCAGGQDLSLLRGWRDSPVPCDRPMRPACSLEG